MERIRLIVADDNTMVRAALRTLLQSIPEFEVIAEANDGVEALELVAEQHPHILLAEISMPRMNGLVLTKRMTQLFPKVRVIVASMYANEEFAERALQAGAAGYLLKDADTLDYRRVINSAFATSGRVPVPDERASLHRRASRYSGAIIAFESDGLAMTEKPSP